MNVAVGKGRSKTKTPGTYRYVPDKKGDGEGGTFVENGTENVDYWHLSVDGVPLAGVWIDEESANRDAATLRHLFAQAKGGKDAS